ncbi:MAG: class I SAM-dependent methyltransferase [Acidobacteriota bacterium]|nr:class I SAM-dependent methyltransferase [Acidobacteriota bacterium]
MRKHSLLLLATVIAVSAASVCTLAQDNARDLQRLVKATGVAPGMAVGEIGAGAGALTVLMAGHVGSEGRVYSTEINEARLEDIRKATAAASVTNVTVLQAGTDATNLPPACCDVIFMRNVYHHFSNPAAVTRSLHASLKSGGRLAIIDFPPRGSRDAASPPDRASDPTHGVRAEVVATELEAAGFTRVSVEEPGANQEGFLVVVRKQ